MVKASLVKPALFLASPRPKHFSYFAALALAICVIVPALAAVEAWEMDAVRVFLPL